VCSGRKRGTSAQGLGRSRGGFSSKLHASTDGLGNPLRLRVTGGERHDITQAVALVEGYAAEAVLADKAYDANSFIEWLAQRDIEIVIPPRKHRKQGREYDEHRYGERHLVECFFNKLKRFRRIFTRYDKLLRNYLSFAYLGAIHIWLR
jgi:transposase